MKRDQILGIWRAGGPKAVIKFVETVCAFPVPQGLHHLWGDPPDQ